MRLGSDGHYAAATDYLASLPEAPVGQPIISSRVHARNYIEELACLDMEYRSMSHDRMHSALQRLRASYYLATGVAAPDERALGDRTATGTISEVTLSKDQQEAMDYFRRAFAVSDVEDHRKSSRALYIVGKPGCGKTELFVQFCAYAIANRIRVLIICPTGQLVASYRQQLPENELIRVGTIHAVSVSIAKKKHWSSMHHLRHCDYTTLS